MKKLILFLFILISYNGHLSAQQGQGTDTLRRAQPKRQQQKRKAGNPMEHLPRNIEVLTGFGERADFSPDNKRVAFMAKSFGDAMVIDLETRRSGS